MDLSIFQIIQFSDRKRFLASIGIGLVCLYILLPILVLSQPIAVTVPISDLNKFSSMDQYNVTLRQFMSLCMTVLSLCLSPIMFFSGLFFTIFSFWTWVFLGDKSSDKYENDINKITAERQKLELKSMKQKEAKAAEQKEQELRDLLKKKIMRSCTGESWKIVENSPYGNLWYDFVVETKEIEKPNVLIKVKFAKSNTNVQLLNLYVTSLIFAWNAYRKDFKRNSRAVGIVLHDKLPNNSHWDIRLLKNNPLALLNLDVDFVNLSEIELINMKEEQIKTLFFPPINKTASMSIEDA